MISHDCQWQTASLVMNLDTPIDWRILELGASDLSDCGRQVTVITPEIERTIHTSRPPVIRQYLRLRVRGADTVVHHQTAQNQSQSRLHM